MKEKKSDNLAYEYWFAGIRALSAGKKWKLHEQLKSGENIYYIEETKLKSLGFLTEKDISAFMKDKPVLHNPCPANKHTQRQYIKDLINSIKKDIHFVKKRIHSAITHPERYNLFKVEE